MAQDNAELIENVFKNAQRIHGKSESVDWIKIASIQCARLIQNNNKAGFVTDEEILKAFPMRVPTEKEIESAAREYE